MPTITALPAAPVRTMDPATFVTTANTWVASLSQFVTDANNLAGSLNTLAAGGAISLPYTFDSTTTDSDPGNGKLRLSSSTQNTSTTLRLDLLGSDGLDYTSVLDSVFMSSTSAVKGQLRLIKVGDATKYMMLAITAEASPTGYRNFTVSVLSSSGANPFTNGDALMLYFTRTGDIGPSGTILRRVFATTSNATPTPDINNYDMYVLTALSTLPTFAAPTGSPLGGQGLMFRIKDDGTARALAWNTIYRAGTDLGLPATTIPNKTLYIGFIYNASDTKWDLVSVLNNI